MAVQSSTHTKSTKLRRGFCLIFWWVKYVHFRSSNFTNEPVVSPSGANAKVDFHCLKTFVTETVKCSNFITVTDYAITKYSTLLSHTSSILLS